jgi:predicted HTH transcriptional regulator
MPRTSNCKGKPVPVESEPVLDALLTDRIVIKHESGRLALTNLGALLFAKDLSKFPGLERKAARVIKYKGNSKMTAEREQVGVKGYASGFPGLISYIDTLVPRSEVIGRDVRHDVPMYPEVAIRELIANALIHQDLSITGQDRSLSYTTTESRSRTQASR